MNRKVSLNRHRCFLGAFPVVARGSSVQGLNVVFCVFYVGRVYVYFLLGDGLKTSPAYFSEASQKHIAPVGAVGYPPGNAGGSHQAGRGFLSRI